MKDAFNSANCYKIFEALAKLGPPKYLVQIVMKFFTRGYWFMIRTKDLRYLGGSTRTGSWPPLWIIMYHEILSFHLPKEVTVIDFADDNGVTIVAQGIKEIEILTNEGI